MAFPSWLFEEGALRQLGSVQLAQEVQQTIDGGRLILADDFAPGDVPPGRIIGSKTSVGATRRGRDAERGISVDNGALRIRWLAYPGWGRAVLAYGPFTDTPGLAACFSLLSGLTTSQTDPRPAGGRATVRRWIATVPRVQWRRPRLRHNLVVGLVRRRWRSRMPEGAAFVVSAGERETGELGLLTDAGSVQRAVWSLQNLPLTLVVVRRLDDTIHYLESAPGARPAGVDGHLLPIGIIPRRPMARARKVYAAIHQSVLGEVKYRVDTRVYDVRVAELDEYRTWCGGAHAADALSDGSPTPGRVAERGGRWAAGHIGDGEGAILDPGAPTGLVRLFLTGELDDRGAVELAFRRSTGGSGWLLRLTRGRAQLVHAIASREQVVAEEAVTSARGRRVLQVTDDGRTMAFHLDGALLFGRWFEDSTGSSGTELGVRAQGQVRLSRFEAHPRAVPLPQAIDSGRRWWRPVQGPVVFRDDFDGPVADLALTGRGWRRAMGAGVIERASSSGAARVRASLSSPNPGRTAYVVPWDASQPVDIAVDVIPPGIRGEGHRGRSGIVLWQDEDNHLVVNHFIDDTSVGVSISAFLRFGGHEQMYDNDAVWSNVADRFRQGRAQRLRVVSDGTRFMAYVDDEPVLYRAFTDYRPDATGLSITAVGLVANWEWGDDTGSEFRQFEVRRCGVDVEASS